VKPRPQVDGLTRTKAGKWRVRIMVGGERRQVTADSKEEADELRYQVRARKIAARLRLPEPPGRWGPTLGGVLDAYTRECETRECSPEHLRSIAYARAILARWRGEAGEAGALRRADLLDFVAWYRQQPPARGRAQTSRARSAHNILVILRTALRLADLPVPASPRLDLPVRAPKTLSRTELARLLRHLPLGTVARTAVEIGLRTGARGAEIRRLRIGDLDLRRRTLLFRRHKGRRGDRGEEVVPVSPGLAKALVPYVAKLPGGLDPPAPLLAVLYDGERRALGPTSLRRQMEAACRAAGLSLRTTAGWTRAQAATLAREAGTPLGVVSGMLGHVDGQITLAHYDESGAAAGERWEARQKAGAVLDEVLGGGKMRHVSPNLRPKSAKPRRGRAS